jgi:hypothetical protein
MLMDWPGFCLNTSRLMVTRTRANNTVICYLRILSIRLYKESCLWTIITHCHTKLTFFTKFLPFQSQHLCVSFGTPGEQGGHVELGAVLWLQVSYAIMLWPIAHFCDNACSRFFTLTTLALCAIRSSDAGTVCYSQ